MRMRRGCCECRTSKWVIVFLIVMSILVAVPAGRAVGRTVPADATDGAELDRAARAAIIDSASAALHDTYVFPDVAVKIEKLLRRKLRKKEYRELATLEAFTRQLTKDFQEVSGDRHLWIAEASNDEIRESEITEPTDEDIARRVAGQAYRNFGFERVGAARLQYRVPEVQPVLRCDARGGDRGRRNEISRQL